MSDDRMSADPLHLSDADDPDGLDAMTMRLVGEAASLLRDHVMPRSTAVDQVVERVRVEAVAGSLLGAIAGSLGRIGRATPDLLGMTSPLQEQ